MLALKGRQDGFRLLFPKEFLVPQVEEKYSNILKEKKGYYMRNRFTSPFAIADIQGNDTTPNLRGIALFYPANQTWLFFI